MTKQIINVKLNLNIELIIAVSAVVISIASFYATYLQAEAANKQVKAMTLPLITFTHGNYDVEREVAHISLQFDNVGVGPAKIYTVNFKYNGQPYANIMDIFRECCSAEYRAYHETLKKDVDSGIAALELTTPYQNVIVPAQDSLDFYQISKHDINDDFWMKLNNVRWDIVPEVCYCSLLDECFITQATEHATTQTVENCDI